MQRWNARNTKAADTPVVEAISVDSAVDPFILDFGTSVNVNEDLRRSIRAETNELDESIVTATASNKQEETVERQLDQDLSHALTEMRNLSRGASDQLESANVHASFLSGLENTLHVDLVQSTGVRSGTGTKVVVEQKTENLPPTSASNSKHATNKDVLREKSEKLKRLTVTMKKTSEEVDSLFRAQKSLVGKTNAIQKAIESESLPSVIEKKRREVELLAVDVQKETQRKQILKATTQKSRAQCGAYAQDVADKTKLLNAMLRENAAEVNELTKRESTAKERLYQRQQAKDEQQSKLSAISSQLEEVQEFERFRKARQEQKAVLELEEEEQTELLRLKEELIAKLQEAQNQLETNNVELEDVQRREAEAAKTKNENDEMHKSIVVPGRVEMVELAQKKEQLAMEIGQQHEIGVAAQAHEKEELGSKLEMKKAVLEELSALKEELEGKRSKSRHFDRVMKESEENWKQEIATHATLEEKYRNALEAKQAHMDEVHEMRMAKFNGRIGLAHEEAANQCAEKERHLQILLYGGEIIENAKATERKLLEDL